MEREKTIKTEGGEQRDEEKGGRGGGRGGIFP